MNAVRSFFMLMISKPAKLLWYTYMFMILFFDFLRDAFVMAIESSKIDMIEIKLLISEKKVMTKIRILLSLLSPVLLLMASIFIAKCSLASKGDTAYESAVLVTGIILIKTAVRSLFGKTTTRCAELVSFRPSNLIFWILEGAECVLFFCIWQELGLGALTVCFFGSVIRSNAMWIKGEIITFETDLKDQIRTCGGEMALGSLVFIIGAVICSVRLASEGISALGIIAASGYCVIRIVKAMLFILDMGFYKTRNSDTCNQKTPVLQNTTTLIQTQGSSISRKTSAKDVAAAILPFAAALAVWWVFSGASLNILSQAASPWKTALAVCLLLTIIFPVGYSGSFHRLASYIVLIPAFILLWPSFGSFSILGIFIMEFGKIIFQWDKYQTYGG